jgi:hypothetical protein
LNASDLDAILSAALQGVHHELAIPQLLNGDQGQRYQ